MYTRTFTTEARRLLLGIGELTPIVVKGEEVKGEVIELPDWRSIPRDENRQDHWHAKRRKRYLVPDRRSIPMTYTVRR
jgi:hypothetical protein